MQEAKNKVKLLLTNIDNMFEKYKLDMNCKINKIEVDEEAGVYSVDLEFDTDNNLKTKLNYLDKLSCVKKCEEENNIRKYTVDIPVSGELNLNTLVDHDSTSGAWNFYKRRYADKLNLDKKEFTYKTLTFEVGGEVDFNFGPTKISWFRHIIKEDNKVSDEEKKIANALLNICEQYNYSLLNFSVMPKVGNLQGTKSGIGNDRFDVFFWAIDLYYKGIDLVVNSRTTAQSMPVLINTLESFRKTTDKYDHNYFQIIYNIDDKELIERLIESGKKRIDSTARVLEYIALAIDVWNIRSIKYSDEKYNDIFLKHGGKRNIKDFGEYIQKLEQYGCKTNVNNMSKGEC